MNTTLRKTRKVRKAFTLMELLVVIGIIALLTSMAAPYYANYANKSKVSLAALVLNDYDTKTMALYNEGQVTPGISSLAIDGTTYSDQTAVGINYSDVIGIEFYAPGDGIVADNAWAFCVYVAGLSFSNYVQGIGGDYSRLCSKVAVNGGIFTRYCGSWDGSSADIPNEYLPDQCNTANISTY